MMELVLGLDETPGIMNWWYPRGGFRLGKLFAQVILGGGVKNLYFPNYLESRRESKETPGSQY